MTFRCYLIVAAVMLNATIATAKDYNLTAHIISYEDNRSTDVVSQMDSSTGVITGSGLTFSGNIRVEVGIDQKVYTTVCQTSR
jgi:hypothetical protein